MNLPFPCSVSSSENNGTGHSVLCAVNTDTFVEHDRVLGVVPSDFQQRSTG